MKTSRYIALILLLLTGADAYSESYFTEITARNSAVKVTNCNNPEALATLSETALTNSQRQITTSQEEDINFRKKLGCTTASKPSKYIIDNTKIIQIGKNRYGASEVINTATGEHRFINRNDLTAYFEIDTSCQPNAMGGQVNRMETDKAGRLYLKKYLVTSTCVDGKAKSNWKPLN
jgi:hypothetical protein